MGAQATPGSPRRTLTVYGDESGDLASAPVFLLGIVLTYEPERHTRAIDAMRSAHGFAFPRQFEYKSTDKHKLRLCKNVIDYFVAEPDLEFQSMMIRSASHDLGRFTHPGAVRHAKVTAYNYRYKQVIASNTSPRDGLVILLDARSRARGDNLPEYLKREIENVRDVQLVDSARHSLIQLTDLLVGSVYGELTNVTHPIKLEIIQHLRSRLNVFRLSDDASLRLSNKFHVYKWQPPKDQPKR